MASGWHIAYLPIAEEGYLRSSCCTCLCPLACRSLFGNLVLQNVCRTADFVFLGIAGPVLLFVAAALLAEFAVH